MPGLEVVFDGSGAIPRIGVRSGPLGGGLWLLVDGGLSEAGDGGISISALLREWIDERLDLPVV